MSLQRFAAELVRTASPFRLTLALIVRIKPRAQREIERAAEWWTENRLAARRAVRQDLEAAVLAG